MPLPQWLDQVPARCVSPALGGMLGAMTLGIEGSARWDHRAAEETGRHELTNEQRLLLRELFPRPPLARSTARPLRPVDRLVEIRRVEGTGTIDKVRQRFFSTSTKLGSWGIVVR